MSAPRPAPTQGVAQGLWRLARLRADGVACFAATPEALLASFAPSLAIGITLALLQSLEGRPAVGASLLLQIVCLVLAAPILSHVLLRLWRQDAGWLRFSTAYVWSRWLLYGLMMLLAAVAHVAVSAGVTQPVAIATAAAFWFACWLRLSWLVARTALGTGWLRTGLLLICVATAACVLLYGPALLTNPSALVSQPS